MIIKIIIFALGMFLAYDIRKASLTIKNGFKCEKLRRENSILKNRITLYEHHVNDKK